MTMSDTNQPSATEQSELPNESVDQTRPTQSTQAAAPRASSRGNRCHLCMKRTYKHTLIALGLYPYVRQVSYIIRQLLEQISAVVPLTVYLGLFLAIFFQKSVDSAGQISGGIIAMIIGLVLFLEGIKYACMPLGELIGHRLPQRVPQWAFLLVCFALGVLCTFAEPAIASLDTLGSLVQPDRAAYLYLMLNGWKTYLTLAIGLGVGVATAIGAWRMFTNRPLLPQIYIVFIPTLALAAYMKWGDSSLDSVIGLAWDCGAITTGPITASAILSISAGIAKAAPSVGDSATSSLGVVTLASLYPILFVEILAIILSLVKDEESIIRDASGANAQDNVDDRSPALRAFLNSLQAALPLLAFLLLVLKFLVRKRIPKISWDNILEDGPSQGDVETTAKADHTRDIRASNRTGVKSTNTGAYNSPDEYGDEEAGLSFDAAMERLAGTDEALHEALAGHQMRHYANSINSEGEGGTFLVPWNAQTDSQRYKSLWHVWPTMARRDAPPIDDGSVIADIYGFDQTTIPSTQELPQGQSASESLNDEKVRRGSSMHVVERGDSHAKRIELGNDVSAMIFDAPPPRRHSINDSIGHDSIEEQDNSPTASSDHTAEHTLEVSDTPVASEDQSQSQLRSHVSMNEDTEQTKETTSSDLVKRSKSMPSNNLSSSTNNIHRKQSTSSVKSEEEARHRPTVRHTNSLGEVKKPAVGSEVHQSDSDGDKIDPEVQSEPSRRGNGDKNDLVIHSRLSVAYLKLWLRKNMFFLTGLLFVPLGLFFINLGIEYGLTTLGQQVGKRLPTVFIPVKGVREDPVLPYTGGLILSSLFVFGLGYLATRAEPALVVLGITVEQLTNGTFSRRKLQHSVAFGVGAGLLLGVLQVFYEWSLFYILIIAYAYALFMSHSARGAVGSAGWDSGGVTTGPVTVPLVLALGISFGNAVDAVQGFGILSCASIAPVAVVLTVNGILTIYAKYKLRQTTS